MSKTKVLFAYCHELARSVSIDEARNEYFSLAEDKRARFTFSCSDRYCNVNVTGVNYDVKAQDGKKYKQAHFRSHVSHKEGCEWHLFTEDIEQSKRPDETDRDFRERQARQKLTDYINCFDPSLDDPETDAATTDILSDDMTRGGNGPTEASDNQSTSRLSRYTRTNQLQRLIDTWQQAKTQLSDDEFRSLRLHVPRIGRIHLHQYVSWISNGLTNRYDGVVHGGATLVHRYGRGFLLNFFDKKEGTPIQLYVSKDVMNQSRFGHYIDEILNTKNVRYFRVFLLNPTVVENTIKGKNVINLEIVKLRQLAIYYELKTKTVEA